MQQYCVKQLKWPQRTAWLLALWRQKEILNSLPTVADDLIPSAHVLLKHNAVSKYNLSSSAVPHEQDTSSSSSHLKESLCKV